MVDFQRRNVLRALWLAAVLPGVLAQSPNVTLPEPVSKPEPEYSEAGRIAGAQGDIVVEFLVDATGIPTEIKVVSSLGFGLSEQAVETVKQWRFKPGTKDGKPVPVIARAETKFRMKGSKFDSETERERTSFNVALYDLHAGDPAKRTKALTRLDRLLASSRGPALYLYANALRQGEELQADVPRSNEFMLKAFSRHYPPAVYEVGKMYVSGNGVPQDVEKGRKLIREASERSADAQYFLGNAHESGSDGYAKDEKLATGYFEKCAMMGDLKCQVRFGSLLVARPQISNSDYLRGLAWIKVSADSGLPEAKTLFAAEQPKLKPDQMKELDQQVLKVVRRRR